MAYIWFFAVVIGGIILYGTENVIKGAGYAEESPRY
jgi:hypothetical protein